MKQSDLDSYTTSCYHIEATFRSVAGIVIVNVSETSL